MCLCLCVCLSVCLCVCVCVCALCALCTDAPQPSLSLFPIPFSRMWATTLKAPPLRGPSRVRGCLPACAACGIACARASARAAARGTRGPGPSGPWTTHARAAAGPGGRVPFEPCVPACVSVDLDGAVVGAGASFLLSLLSRRVGGSVQVFYHSNRCRFCTEFMNTSTWKTDLLSVLRSLVKKNGERSIFSS